MLHSSLFLCSNNNNLHPYLDQRRSLPNPHQLSGTVLVTNEHRPAVENGNLMLMSSPLFLHDNIAISLPFSGTAQPSIEHITITKSGWDQGMGHCGEILLSQKIMQLA